MTLTRQLLTSKRNTIHIASDDQRIINHFANPHNYADVVLDMFNHDRFYDEFFRGWDDLMILDIGANIGLFSLYIQDRARVVYALEPTAAHYDILCELTKNYQNIKPMPIALHNRDESIDFYISDDNSTMNSTVNKYGKKTTVQGKTLGTLLLDLNLDKVDFVKCDIEGSEMAAITDDTIGAVSDKIKVWSMEVHATDPNLSWEASLNRNRDMISNLLTRHGYKTYIHRHDCLYAYKV